MMDHGLVGYVAAIGLSCFAVHATAEPPSAEGAARLETGQSPSSAGFRLAPFEFGVFAGVFLPSSSHELLSLGPFAEYDSPAPELGARAAVFALPSVGLEVEGAAMPTETTAGDPAGIWAVRLHVVAQAPLGQLVPFAIAGGGRLGAGSNTLGSDSDPALHFGLGAKIALDEFLSIRLDLRDTLAQKHNAAPGAQTHFPEVLLGLGFGLRRISPPKPAEPEPPKDLDRDGLLDEKDACPKSPGTLPNGCPIADLDGDRVFDDKDACPRYAGAAPCGCPPEDADGDKVIDELDRCPSERGPIEGCPDADRDGVASLDDSCPDVSETENGFEDADGCPDESPKSIEKGEP